MTNPYKNVKPMNEAFHDQQHITEINTNKNKNVITLTADHKSVQKTNSEIDSKSNQEEHHKKVLFLQALNLQKR